MAPASTSNVAGNSPALSPSVSTVTAPWVSTVGAAIRREARTSRTPGSDRCVPARILFSACRICRRGVPAHHHYVEQPIARLGLRRDAARR